MYLYVKLTWKYLIRFLLFSEKPSLGAQTIIDLHPKKWLVSWSCLMFQLISLCVCVYVCVCVCVCVVSGCERERGSTSCKKVFRYWYKNRVYAFGFVYININRKHIKGGRQTSNNSCYNKRNIRAKNRIKYQTTNRLDNNFGEHVTSQCSTWGVRWHDQNLLCQERTWMHNSLKYNIHLFHKKELVHISYKLQSRNKISRNIAFFDDLSSIRMLLHTLEWSRYSQLSL